MTGPPAQVGFEEPASSDSSVLRGDVEPGEYLDDESRETFEPKPHFAALMP
jgi:hypothetical protein